MTKATLLLCWFTLFVNFSNAVEERCNYYQEMVPDDTYYVHNNEYPSYYQGAQSCLWTLESDYRVNLTCRLQLPWSYNCDQDQLVIQVSQNKTHRYCGTGSFNLQSEGDTMSVSLTAPTYTSGGRFSCEAKAIERPQDMEGNCTCGWKNPTRIVGGTTTGVNEYPMMAGLVDSDKRMIVCGSTIISTQHVVTAAHCLTGKSIPLLGVLVGEHDTSLASETNATVLYKISEAYVHPNYDEETRANDIAVLRIRGTITYSNEVGPACLPVQHSPDTFGGNYVVALGWGLLDFGGEQPTALQEVTLSVLTNLDCSKSYPNVNRNQICTYAEGKDTCQMDSGGPVLWQNPTSRRLVLVGAISYGIACGIESGVNTRVGGYVDWIVSVTPDASYCNIE